MGLLHWWPLGGDLKDRGYGHTDLINEGASFTDNSKLALSLQTTDGQRVKGTDLARLASLETYSMGCWFCVDAPSTAHSASFLSSGNWNSTNQNVAFGLNGYNSTAQVYTKVLVPGPNWSTGFYLSAKDYIKINTWYHLFIVCYGGTVSLFINGNYIARSSEENVGKITSTDVDYYYLGAATYYNGFTLKGKMNDFRVYDSIISRKEIEELARLKVCELNFNTPKLPYTNLIGKDEPLVIYNNYNQPASLVKLEETYHGNAIYRLTFTVTDSKLLGDFQVGLYSHGVYSQRKTFLANTKYVHYIYFRPVTHTDITVGGTASNTGGWHAIDQKQLANGWFVTGQYKDGTVNETKTDHIFTSFCCPSLSETNNTISIDFTCPTLIKGHMFIPTRYNEYKNEKNAQIHDDSGYGNFGDLFENNCPSWKGESRIGTGAYVFDGTQEFTHPCPFSLNSIKDQEWTICAWIKIKDASKRSYLNDFAYGQLLSTSSTPLLYLNAGADDYYIYANQNFKTQEWIHVAYVFRNSDGYRKIYQNAVDISKSGPNKTSTPKEFQEWTTVGRGFNGEMACYQVYGTALSPEAIKDLYQVGAQIYSKNSFKTNVLCERYNLLNGEKFDQRSKGVAVNQNSKQMIYQGRNCLRISAGSFYIGATKTFISIIDPKLFKPDTSYRFCIMLNSNLISDGVQVDGGLLIHYIEKGSEKEKVDYSLIGKTSGSWQELNYKTPPNSTITAVTVYYYTGQYFYIDLSRSYIQEVENTSISKKQVLTSGQLIEDLSSSFKILKNGNTVAKEFIES